MGGPDLPDRLRRREEELDRQPPLDLTRTFLSGYVAHVDGLEDLRGQLRQIAAHSLRGLHRHLVALERVLAAPQPPGTLAQVVAWDANWVLDDLSDSAAEAFLGQVAAVLAEVIDEAERARGSRRGPAAFDG